MMNEDVNTNALNTKLTQALNALTLTHFLYVNDKGFNRLSKMYEYLLNGYLQVTEALYGAIIILNKNNVSIPNSVISNNTQYSLEFFDLFKKVDGEGNLTDLQSKVKATLAQETPYVKTYSDFKENFLGIPLIESNKIVGCVILTGLKDPEAESSQPYMLNLNQCCLVVTVGYQADQRNKEALGLMKVKDEMLDIYTSRMEQQNIELIKAKEEAEMANQSKNSFITNLGHEFRTPLTTIMGTSELLQMTQLSEKQLKSVKNIYSSAEILLALINDLLDLSKIDAGTFKIELQDVDLPVLIQDLIDMFMGRAFEKKIRFYVYFDPSLPHQIKTDRLRLQQVLMNLLGNAFKFTKTGYIMLSLKPMDGDRILFEVVDTGIGIPENAKEKLFQKFSQVDSTIARRFGGTGLGLALSKEMVELMQGKIMFSSKEEEGSVFSFHIPHYQKTKTEISASLKDKSVLLISSDEIMQNTLQLYLIYYGAQVRKASIGKNFKIEEDFVVIANYTLEKLSDHVLNVLKFCKAKILFVSVDDGVSFDTSIQDISYNKIVYPIFPWQFIEVLVG
jgi:signal transduction histidine kinase